ncbi:MAG TPA: ATPase, T2SS/T4P/T4SS family [Candidatus Saccharimonadales bacterium]|jgi:type II secretory ATPase GspE/PulE/Tfp pilus assembly ATPase PilB-like protein|nr:ATPase, T2SS/T4P/T4SS family [Candidatus Saccharimonadales bacterium]
MPTTQPVQIAQDSDIVTLVDVLVSMGALDATRAEQVKLAEIQSGSTQEEIIKKNSMVPEEKLVQAKAQLYNIPYLDLAVTPVAPAALASLPAEVAERFKVFPISIDRKDKSIILAMTDPMDLSAIEFIEQKTGLHVKPRAALPSQIEDYIRNRYTSSLTQQVTAALKEIEPEKDRIAAMENPSGGFIREEKVSQIVSQILDFAMKARASDVHIEPQEKLTRVRYRIDGILQEKLSIPSELHDSLISRIKILSGMKIDEKRIPQDGRFNFKGSEEEVDLRISSLPTTWGEKIVMRLLKKSGGVPDLPELGLRGRGLKTLQDAILRPHGIIIICGPTGSGKTTTLYSVISKLNTSKVNIVTLEDPIEYKIPGVNQVQINPAVGLTFADGLRAFLRQDPNIILVGEIRDRETADLAVQASLTGHLVFSTLHTNDASGALPRLLDMGAEPYLLASSMTCIVAQRVVRKIHETCKEAYTPDPKVVADMKKELGNLWQPQGEIKFYKGKGDPDCGNSGYYGRMGIFEVIPISEKIGKLILERASASDIEKMAKEEGMITLKQDGYLKVTEGITTVDEVLRVAQE